jgi:hypothetical protein
MAHDNPPIVKLMGPVWDLMGRILTPRSGSSQMVAITSGMSQPRFGQFWAMRDGGDGKCGNPGNEESATYRFQILPKGSNPSLSASLFHRL